MLLTKTLVHNKIKQMMSYSVICIHKHYGHLLKELGLTKILSPHERVNAVLENQAIC